MLVKNRLAQAFPIFLFVFLFLASCHSSRQLAAGSPHAGRQERAFAQPDMLFDPAGRKLIDSILQAGLDHEALYTMFGAIKPMSSLVSFSFPLDDTSKYHITGGDLLGESHKLYLDSLYTIQSALNTLDLPDLRFIMTPYNRTINGKRHIQISVLRISLLDSLLQAESSFFGHFGFVPGADPGIVLNTIEFEDTYKRWRGYGYLFGYPPYAVDFFVEAGATERTEGRFVERDFFAIPVHTRPDGHFVYAIPKGHRVSQEPDSVLYSRAVKILEKYRAIRPQYLNADSTLQAYRLLSDFLQTRPD